jgi:hypothetical protein
LGLIGFDFSTPKNGEETQAQGCKDASADAKAKADKMKGRGRPAFGMILSLRRTATDCDRAGLEFFPFAGHFGQKQRFGVI